MKKFEITEEQLKVLLKTLMEIPAKHSYYTLRMLDGLQPVEESEKEGEK